MKKILLVLSLVFVTVLSPVSAKDTYVDTMTITATLDQDGNAHIQEIWEMDVYEGTEVYKIMDNMNDKKISHLSVIDDKNNVYKNIGEWDVDASKAEKANKCGLVNDGDYYELCFGIGEYGHRTYTFEYDVSHFVEQYDGDQGFNFAFFSDIALDIDNVRITIEYPGYEFNESNSAIYAYGYEGYIVYNKGRVVMGNEGMLESDSNKMQIVMRIDDGTFSNLSKVNRTFDDILEEANEQNSLSFFEIIMMVVIGICILLGFVVVVIAAMNKQEDDIFEDDTKITNATKDVNMFRDIPCHKDLFQFYYLAKQIGLINENDKAGLVSAILLKWVRDGKIVFEKVEGKKGLFFKKDGFSIDLDGNIIVDNPFEKRLLEFFKQASGDNLALEDGEFENWCEDHYDKIEDWFEDIDIQVKKELKDVGLIQVQKREKLHFGFIKDRYVAYIYTHELEEEMRHIAGLKKFLTEMSSIDKKEVIEVKLWEEYLIFASVLGIAEQVEKQLGVLCPNFVEESHIDIYYTTHAVRHFSHTSMSTVMMQSGSGGHSSFGGGGGSFSGGGGGGVR